MAKAVAEDAAAVTARRRRAGIPGDATVVTARSRSHPAECGMIFCGHDWEGCFRPGEKPCHCLENNPLENGFR
ncbi:hypothetical protein ACFV0L_04365 [Streptosporangium canum]|uniref:hypothetical protein n=1 Tax=Streptosporangium canum TaxID=324952 RepID=UPI00368B04A2